MLDEHGKALLIKVSSAAADQAATAAQMLLIQEDRKLLGQEENALLQKYVRELNLPSNQQISNAGHLPEHSTQAGFGGQLERKVGEAHWIGRTDQSETHLALDEYLSPNPLELDLAGKGPTTLHARGGCFRRDDRPPAGRAAHPGRIDRLSAGLRSGSSGQIVPGTAGR